MAESLEVEHQRRLRAERVQAMLRQLWGDEAPPSPAAALTVLIDAVGIDDLHSIDDQLVSQGDGLSYRLLAVLCQHYLTVPPAGSASLASPVGLQLPQILGERLQALQLLSSLAPQVQDWQEEAPIRSQSFASELVGQVDPRSGPTPWVGRSEESARVGVWELDPESNSLAFDDVAAVLMGAGQAGGHSTLTQHLEELIHPDDRDKVAAAVAEALGHQSPYQVRFRVQSALGVITHLISHGRVLRKPSDPSPRLTGYLTIDREGPQRRGGGGC